MSDSGSATASKNAALVIAIIASFVGAFMMTGMTIALPEMGRDLSIGAVQLGWVVTAFSLTTAAFFLPAGRLADIHGRKKMFLSGQLIFAASSLLCGLAPSPFWLIVGRALQGVGSAVAASNSLAILTSVFPDEERGKAIGTSLAFTYVGATVGPFLGGVMTEHLGWRSLFITVGILCLVTIVLIIWKLKGEWAEARGERFDTAGFAIFGVSLVVLMYGFTVLLTVTGMVLVVVGALGVAAFFWWEARTPHPLLNVTHFRRNHPFVFSNLATLINYSAALAGIIFLTLYLQYNKGFSPQVAGMILLAHSATMALVSPIAGRLSDRVAAPLLAAIGLAINSLVFVLFFFLSDTTPLWLVIIGLAVFGTGWGFFSSPNSNAVMGSVERKYLGVASAMVGTMRSVGMMFSMGINLILFSIYLGNVEITPEYYPAFLMSAKVGFAIFAILSIGGVFIQLAGRKPEKGVANGQSLSGQG